MRFTSNTVSEIAKAAQELTGGKFRLSGVGGDIGNGTRYINGGRQIVWLGRTGGAEAAAYYAHGAVAYVEGTDAVIPEIITAAIEATKRHHAGAVHQWAAQGKDDGTYRRSDA